MSTQFQLGPYYFHARIINSAVLMFVALPSARLDLLAKSHSCEVESVKDGFVICKSNIHNHPKSTFFVKSSYLTGQDYTAPRMAEEYLLIRIKWGKSVHETEIKIRDAKTENQLLIDDNGDLTTYVNDMTFTTHDVSMSDETLHVSHDLLCDYDAEIINETEFIETAQKMTTRKEQAERIIIEQLGETIKTLKETISDLERDVRTREEALEDEAETTEKLAKAMNDLRKENNAQVEYIEKLQSRVGLSNLLLRDLVKACIEWDVPLIGWGKPKNITEAVERAERLIESDDSADFLTDAPNNRSIMGDGTGNP